MKIIPVILLSMIVGAETVHAQIDTLTILHINDTHSHLAPIGPRDASLKGTLGGIARVATVVKENRMTEPNVLFLHAGDAFTGDIFFNAYFGIPEFQILKGLGLDAMTLGNHEFDLGPDVLSMSFDFAFMTGGFPILCANLADNASTPAGLKARIVPYVIKQFGSHHVGVFGLTTPSTNEISNPSPAVISDDVTDIARASVAILKTHNCDVIICLSHLGYDADSILASSVSGINVIVGGHDHYLFETPHQVINPFSDTVWIVQAGSYYQYVGKMKMAVGNGSVRLLDYEVVKIDSTISEDAATAATVDGLVSGIERTYGPLFSKQIATASADMGWAPPSSISSGKKDAPIGDLVTDAFCALTKTQIAFDPSGLIQEPLYHGPVVGDDLFRVVGFGFNTDNSLGFRLETLEMSGASIMAGLEYGLSSGGSDGPYFAQASGMTYSYAPDSLPGHRLTEVKVGGADIDPQAEYTVTVNETVPPVLDQLGIKYSDLYLMRDTTEFLALSNYVKSLGTVSPSIAGRITDVKRIVEQGSLSAQRFELLQNYPNPFNPTTVISYQISAVSHVTLKVYDVLGREVETLVNENQNAGNYTVTFDGSSFPSGVYFYRLQAGTNIVTKKLLLLK